MPQRITQISIVNLYIASKVKQGARAYKNKGENSSLVWKAISTINKYEPVTISDRVISLLAEKNADKEMYRTFAKYLIKEGESLKVVKFGLSLLGVFGTSADVDLVKELGNCEEFTFFAVKTLHRLVEPKAFRTYAVEFAEKLKGWGKVASILELPDDVEDDELKERILSINPQTDVNQNLAVEIVIKGSLFSYLIKAKENDTPELMQNKVLNIFNALFDAENVKDADSFNEVPNMKELAKTYCELVENGNFQNNEKTTEVVENLKLKFNL